MEFRSNFYCCFLNTILQVVAKKPQSLRPLVTPVQLSSSSQGPLLLCQEGILTVGLWFLGYSMDYG